MKRVAGGRFDFGLRQGEEMRTEIENLLALINDPHIVAILDELPDHPTGTDSNFADDLNQAVLEIPYLHEKRISEEEFQLLIQFVHFLQKKFKEINDR